jgi:hypothetical protein
VCTGIDPRKIAGFSGKGHLSIGGTPNLFDLVSRQAPFDFLVFALRNASLEHFGEALLTRYSQRRKLRHKPTKLLNERLVVDFQVSLEYTFFVRYA